MSGRVYISRSIMAALKAIDIAGHGVELEMGVGVGAGGNNHTVTNIIIGVRHPDEAAYVHKLKVKHVSSYGGKFVEFYGMSEEFGELCSYAQLDIAPFLSVIADHVEEWRGQANDLQWIARMAKV